MKKEKEEKNTATPFIMAPTDDGAIQWDDVTYHVTLEDATQEGNDFITASSGNTVCIYKLAKVLELEVKTTDVK